jgi:flagellar hook-length control protein FliK
MSTTAVEPSIPALAAGVLGNPPAADLGAAEAFALAIQLALGVATTVPTTAAAEGTSEATDADGTEEADAMSAAFLVPTLLPLPTVSTAPATTTTTDAPPGIDAAAAGAEPATASGPEELPATPGTTDEATSAARSQDSTPETATDTATAGPAPQPATAPALNQAAPQVTTVTQVAGPADAAGTPAPRVVANQVIPEVTKLFSNGEGVHRVTLELNPRALGEVRVVLTVRHGDVHVRLAAGSEAREALALSSGDLARALEHIGVKDHRLTLAELPGVTASASTQTFSDTTEKHDQNASFTGRFDTEQHPDSRHSRMGDGSTATDGTDHEHGSRTRGNRSIHEVNHVPSRGGVDLRM